MGGRIACVRSLQCLRHEMCSSGLEGNGSHIGLAQEKTSGNENHIHF